MTCADLVRTVAILILLAGGGVLSTAGHAQELAASNPMTVTSPESPDPIGPDPDHDPTDEEDECRKHPATCVVGTAIFELMAPIFETALTDVHTGFQPPSAPFALRVEHRARWIDELASRSHPFLGLGIRSMHRSPRSPFPGRKRTHWELAAGYQQSLAPLLGGRSVVGRSAIVGAEVQWLNSNAPDHLRAQLNAGFEFHLPRSQRLIIQTSVASSIAGPYEGTVQPGVSIGYAW